MAAVGAAAEHTPEISAVVITRNEEVTVGHCLESVLAALAGRSFEVVLVDSASTDRTVEIARRYPVRVVVLPATAPRRPAVGRHVGFRSTRGALVLFVDGDCVLDPTWLQPALDALEADSGLAGVSGAADAVRPGEPGETATVQDQYPGVEYENPGHLSGSALYRRAVLEPVGGFNPFMYACEEIELGARVRQAGHRLSRLRTRMTQHFPKAPKETVPELLRRFRQRYFVGLGQLARQTIAHRLPVARPLRSIDRHLAFFALLGMGALGTLTWAIAGRPQLLIAWLVVMGALFAVFSFRAGGFRRPAYYFLEWTVTSPMVVWGLLARPRSARDFPPIAPAAEGTGRGGTTAGRRLRETALRLALIAAAFSVAGIACELATRVLSPQLLYRYPHGFYAPAALRGYTLAPGFRGTLDTPEYTTAFAINSLGLREEREYGTKPPGTFRILVLGDSFTAGVGVEAEDTFEKVIERELNARGSGPRFEVVNTGVPGYGTREELLLLRQVGPGLQPDLVLLAFFVGNDVFENTRTTLPGVIGGELVTDEVSTGILSLPVRGFLSRHSHLYHLAWPYSRLLLGRNGDDVAQRKRAFALYGRPDAASVAPGWQATDRWLRHLVHTTRTHRIPLAVAVIPDPLQIDATAWQARRAAVAADDPDVQRHRPDEQVARILGRYGIPVVDLLPPLEQAPSPGTLYFPQDGHWTPRGHRVAGASIVTFLRREGLVPPASTE